MYRLGTYYATNQVENGYSLPGPLLLCWPPCRYWRARVALGGSWAAGEAVLARTTPGSWGARGPAGGRFWFVSSTRACMVSVVLIRFERQDPHVIGRPRVARPVKYPSLNSMFDCVFESVLIV